MIKSGFLLSLLSLLTGLASAQSIYRASYASAEIALVIPKGYCVIDRNDPLGALHYKLQEDGNRGKNLVAVLFADCREWTERKKDGALLKHHGNYLFQLTRGEQLLLPVGFTRADLVKVYVDYESRKSGKHEEELAREANRRLQSSDVAAPKIHGPVNFGMIDRDSQAVFLGFGGTYETGGQTYRVIGVTAATMTARVPMSVNLYAPPSRSAPFRTLLAEQKDLVRRLIQANE